MTDYLLSIAAIGGGILCLFFGGDRLVARAAHLAVSHRVPKTVVGAIILGFGTSLPELFVSVTAALEHSPEIAIGNVVGSNIANIGLILGTGAVLVGFRMQPRVIRWDLPFGLGAILLLMIGVGPDRPLSRPIGLVLLAAFTLYLWGSFRYARASRRANDSTETSGVTTGRDLLWIVVGLVAITVGSELLVRGAQRMAELLEVPELIIGLTMVALGTSLPELAALLAAVRRNEADLALGNIAGSNLFNILFILGTTAVITEIPVASVMVKRDFPVVALMSVLAFPFLWRARRVGRRQGTLLLACFVGYVCLVWVWGR
ncbi:MAG: calcium/sodium antiporter [Planctomycetota bacterium]|jgi:cation:H+ antiporter